MTDIVTAARRFLVNQPTVTTLTGYTDGPGEWIYQWNVPEGSVEGSEDLAIILSVGGAWTQGNPHNTARFPRLRVEYLADADRTEEGPTNRDAPNKILEAHSAVHAVLHHPDGDQWWDDVRVIHCVGLDEPTPERVGDHAAYAQTHYGLTLG